jgi:hypothetical protein
MVSSATFANYSMGSLIGRRGELAGYGQGNVGEIALRLDPESDL